MGISTSTGTLTAGQSRTFNLSPASAVTLTLSPNVRVTITETPATVAATGLGGNASRVHEPRLPGVVTYGPYPMGGSVLVENESNSGSSVAWVRSDSIVAESADGSSSLVDAGGNLVAISKKMTAALIGDSFTARNTTNGSATRDLDYGYFSWFQALSGGPLRLVMNGGVSSETTTQILARVQTVAATGAAWFFVQGGINDVTAGTPIATIIANLKAICTALSGGTVVFMNIAPNTQSAGNSTKVQAINQAMREWCQSVAPGVIYVDAYAALVNPTSTTGAYASGMSDDALHLSAKGARAAGNAIAQKIQAFLPNRAFLPSSAGESYGIDNTSKQILDNPLMVGAGSAASGAGASGTAPTSWLGSVSGTTASAVFSQVSRSDGFGNDAQIVVSGAASGASVNIRQTSLVGRAAIGDTVYLVGQIVVTGAADIRTVNIGGSVVIDGVTSQINCLEYISSTNYDQSDLVLNFRSNDLLLTGTTITAISFIPIVTFGTSGAGAATIKIGRCGMYKY